MSALNFIVAWGADEVLGEGAQAGDDVRVLANARSVSREVDVAKMMAGVLDQPIAAYPLAPGPLLRRTRPGKPSRSF